jgi:hypothetical protein
MSSTKDPRKRNPATSGQPKPKGEGKEAPVTTDRADQPTDKNTDAQSEDERPKYEGKAARKRRLEEEAEYQLAWETASDRNQQEVWGTEGPTDTNQEEVERFLACTDDLMDVDSEAPTKSLDTSEASRPTSVWSVNSDQYLMPPPPEGYSSSASSKASKRRRSPSPLGPNQRRASHQGRGNFHEPRPRSLRHVPSMEEENQLLREENQRLREYGREDQMRIGFLQKQLETERKLGHAEGLAQATQLQLQGPAMDREQGRGYPPSRRYDDAHHARDMSRAMEDSRRTYREESRGRSPSGAGPSRRDPSSSRPHPPGPPRPSGPPRPNVAPYSRQREQPTQPPPTELVVRTKTNNWPEPRSIKPERLHCLPLPDGAQYTATKTAVVSIVDAAPSPEAATSYAQLWAGFARGITVPETFLRMFRVLGRQMNHDYYQSMALGYIIFRRIAAANTHALDRDALNGLIVTLAVFRRQVPRLPRIWDEILNRSTAGEMNNWAQARRFMRHAAVYPPDYGLAFFPPNTPNAPWGIRTQWSERELTGLLLAIRPNRDALQNLLHFADAFVRTRPASTPLRGLNIAGLTPETMFSASFVTAAPFPDGLAPAPTPNPGEPSAPEDKEVDSSVSTVRVLRHKASKPPP